jgi:hypothetical protein
VPWFSKITVSDPLVEPTTVSANAKLVADNTA